MGAKILTWDEIYRAAEGKTFGDSDLKVYDNARSYIESYAMEHYGIDIEKEEIPEETIDDFIKVHPELDRFNESGQMLVMNENYKKKENKVGIDEPTNYVLAKLVNAGIEVITDKEEFDRIFEREKLLQKMNLSEEDQRRYFTFDEEDTKKFKEHVNEWQKDNINPSKLIVVGKITPVMKILGISEKLIEVEQSTLDKIIRDTPVYPNDKQGHKLSVDDIYAIPSQLADPVMVFKSRTRNDSFVFFTERKDSENHSILIPLVADKRKGKIIIHEISSMYGKDNEIDFVRTNIDENNLVYEDRKRSCLWAKEKIEELEKRNIKDAEKNKSSNGGRFTQIQFLGQRFTDKGTYRFNILTKERLVNFISSQNPKINSSQNMVLSDGITYGFTHEGTIYLNPDFLNSNIAVHEYTHLWDAYTQKTNPELWDKGLKIFKDTSIWNEVINDENYADIKDDDNLILSECHSRICGKIAESVLQKVLERDGDLKKAEMIKWDSETVQYLYDNFKDVLQKENSFLMIQEFMAMPMQNLFIHGKKLELNQSTEKTWTWHDYDDLSGHLEAPDGKKYFVYDWTTKEYMCMPTRDSYWDSFVDADPTRDTSLAAFKTYAEKYIRNNIAKNNGIVFERKYIDTTKETENEIMSNETLTDKYDRMEKFFEGMTSNVGPAENLKFKELYDWVHKEFPEKDRENILFETVSRMVYSNIDFGRLEPKNYDDVYGNGDGADQRFDVSDDIAKKLINKEIPTNWMTIQGEAFEFASRRVKDLKNNEPDMQVTDRIDKAFEISSDIYSDTPENRAILKENGWLLERPLEFDFSEFTESDFNKIRDELLKDNPKEDYYGRLYIGSLHVDFVINQPDGWVDTSYYILGEEGEGEAQFGIPYNYFPGHQFAANLFTDNTYEEFKEKVLKAVLDDIAEESSLKKEAMRSLVDWNNEQQCKELYRTKLVESARENEIVITPYSNNMRDMEVIRDFIAQVERVPANTILDDMVKAVIDNIGLNKNDKNNEYYNEIRVKKDGTLEYYDSHANCTFTNPVDILNQIDIWASDHSDSSEKDSIQKQDYKIVNALYEKSKISTLADNDIILIKDSLERLSGIKVSKNIADEIYSRYDEHELSLKPDSNGSFHVYDEYNGKITNQFDIETAVKQVIEWNEKELSVLHARLDDEEITNIKSKIEELEEIEEQIFYSKNLHELNFENTDDVDIVKKFFQDDGFILDDKEAKILLCFATNFNDGSFKYAVNKDNQLYFNTNVDNEGWAFIPENDHNFGYEMLVNAFEHATILLEDEQKEYIQTFKSFVEKNEALLSNEDWLNTQKNVIKEFTEKLDELKESDSKTMSISDNAKEAMISASFAGSGGLTQKAFAENGIEIDLDTANVLENCFSQIEAITMYTAAGHDLFTEGNGIDSISEHKIEYSEETKSWFVHEKNWVATSAIKGSDINPDDYMEKAYRTADRNWEISCEELVKYVYKEIKKDGEIEKDSPDMFKKLESLNQYIESLTEAKELISDFCFDEYMSTPSFDDLKDVGLAYTTLKDPYTHEEYEVQTSADLVNSKIITKINDKIAEISEYGSLKEMVNDSLKNLAFDGLIYVPTSKVDEFLKEEREDIEKNLLEKADQIISETFDEPSLAKRAKLYVPSDYGYDADNKIHVLVEFDNNAEREDDLFNVLAERHLVLPNGKEVDFNPIKPEKSGTIEEYLKTLSKINENRFQRRTEVYLANIKVTTENFRDVFNEVSKLPKFKNKPLEAAGWCFSKVPKENKAEVGKWLSDLGCGTKKDSEKLFHKWNKENNTKSTVNKSKNKEKDNLSISV